MAMGQRFAAWRIAHDLRNQSLSFDVRDSTLEAFAAGVILALVAETMIPEAFHGSPQFNGLLLVVGFVALLILLVLSQ
jgi:Co/Zn/Cd efflux system component